MTEMGDREVFQKLKAFCIPLLKHAELTPAAVPTIISLLSGLEDALNELERQYYQLSSSLASYTAFPLLSLLRRNPMSSIPDRVLELMFLCLRSICESWWWTLDVATWEQLFMLCGSAVGGVNGNGKAKARDDEARTAAVRCLRALTRPRTEDEGLNTPKSLEKFTAHARDPRFTPIIGHTLDALLSCTSSVHRPLKLACLQVLGILLEIYAPDDFTPIVLPGVMSSMTRLVLGTSNNKGWENGDLVADGLRVAQVTIIRAIGDDVCLRAGAVKDATSLDDLAAFTEGAQDTLDTATPGSGVPRTSRTPTWLRGTSTQLHIALNTLTPLVSHPNSAALVALASFSSAIIGLTTLTLPASQALLASFLLSLTASVYETVAEFSAQQLRDLLLPERKARHSLLQTLVQITRDNLSAIPRLLLSHADAKVEHVAHQIEAIGRLASGSTSDPVFGVISTGIGKLLGPTGGVERWAWRLLSALEFAPPTIVVTDTTTAQLLLESDHPVNALLHFPELEMLHIATRTTQTALECMFVALGSAAGEDALYTVEWFVSLGRQTDSRGIASLWCASRVLEGMASVRLSQPETSSVRHSRNLEKATRGLVSSLSEIWERAQSDVEPSQTAHEEVDEDFTVEHSRGIIALEKNLGVRRHTLPAQDRAPTRRPLLHRAVALQALCICAGILQARFTPMLLRALYPILQSIVSPISFLSTTGLAALDYVSTVASYATPANMLLSNFDYALDAVSRRLSRERLDLDAMKVLVLLVRLVGPDIVHRAGDLVEECFSRLDEYHGYSIIVDGLVEVLGEVVKVIEQSEEARVVRDPRIGAPPRRPPEDNTHIEVFMQWCRTRNDPPDVDNTDYGPAPRHAWETSRDEVPAEKEREDDGPIDVEKPRTPLQVLTKQIVSRSIYFLTHQSSLIRARILTLLASAVPVLPESAILPSVHEAWPFILNRFSDPEPFVISRAATLVEALALNVGTFMYRRVWDDVWPILRRMLKTLEASDMQNALTRRGVERAGPESVYAHSFRLYRAMIKTMTASALNVQVQDDLTWEVLIAFRRFLHREAHEELQVSARELYDAIGRNNEDAVWLALVSTSQADRQMTFLERDDWDIEDNVRLILGSV